MESNNITCEVQSEDSTLFQGSTNQYLEEEILFTICSSNEECLDYDGCSEDLCNQKTKVCENKINSSNCSDCEWVSVLITPNNYPEETSSSIPNYDNEDLVLFGDLCLRFDRVQGR